MTDLFPIEPDLPGFVHRPLLGCGQTQRRALVAVHAVAEAAPFYTPTMPRTGKGLLGADDQLRAARLGVGPRRRLSLPADASGDGRAMAARSPRWCLAVWHAVSGYPHPPEACLVNYYAPGAKLGLHQDSDEQDFAAPVVSLSLGDDCRFPRRRDHAGRPTRALRLMSGDVVVLGGASRLAFHGVDRIYPGTSTLLRDWFPEGGRINLTLRRVTRPG